MRTRSICLALFPWVLATLAVPACSSSSARSKGAGTTTDSGSDTGCPPTGSSGGGDDGGDPTLLADGLTNPADLVLAGTTLFWVAASATPNVIMSMPITGGTPKTVLTQNVIDLTTDGTALYFLAPTSSSDVDLDSCALDGTNLKTLATGSFTTDASNATDSLYAVGGKLYFGDGPTLAWLPTSGGTPTPLWTPEGGALSEISRLAYASSSQAYFLSLNVQAFAQSFDTVPLAGGSPVTFLTTLENPPPTGPVPLTSGGAVAVANGNVYFLEKNTPSFVLMQAPATGGTPTPLTTFDGAADYIVADDGGMFVGIGDEALGSIQAVSPSGAQTLFQNSAGRDLVLDANNLYWVGGGFASGQGSLHAAPRNGSAPQHGSPSGGSSCGGSGGSDASVPDSASPAVDSGTSVDASSSADSGGTVDSSTPVDSATAADTGTGADTGTAADTGGGDGASAFCSTSTNVAPGETAVALACGQSTPEGIAVHAGIVYWTNYVSGGTVMSVPETGGTPTTVASGLDWPWAIAVDDTNVYFTTYAGAGADTLTGAAPAGGAVWKVPVGGGTPVMLDSPVNGPWGIAVDATNVYYTAFSGGRVKSVPIAGGTPVVLATGVTDPVGIAVSGATVTWATLAGALTSAGKGDGGAPTVLATAAATGGALSVAVNASSVFFTNDTATGDVLSVATTGGTPPATVATGQNHPFGIALDGTNVYWTTNVAGGTGCTPPCGTLSSASLAGGTGTTLVTQLANPSGIAVDGTGIYFAASSGGRVWRVSPP